MSGGPATRCASHKEPGMVNVVSKRCEYPGGCDKLPNFGNPGGPATRCMALKELDMVDV